METARMLFLKVVLTNDPDNVAALTELGWKYEEEEHNYDAAVSTLKRALEVAQEMFDLIKYGTDTVANGHGYPPTPDQLHLAPAKKPRPQPLCGERGREPLSPRTPLPGEL